MLRSARTSPASPVVRVVSILALTMLALTPFVLTACGSGRLGTQEYLARGDRQCDRITSLANRFGRPQTLPQLARKTRAVDIALQVMVTDLRSRRPPRALERPARTYLALVVHRIALDRRLLVAVEAGVKNPIIVAGVRRNMLDVKVNAAATRVGFQRCVVPTR